MGIKTTFYYKGEEDHRVEVYTDGIGASLGVIFDALTPGAKPVKQVVMTLDHKMPSMEESKA